MKKILIVLLAVQTLITGCSTDDLGTNPSGVYTEDTFWTSEKTASAALAACYRSLMGASLFGVDAPLLEDTALYTVMSGAAKVSFLASANINNTSA